MASSGAVQQFRTVVADVADFLVAGCAGHLLGLIGSEQIDWGAVVLALQPSIVIPGMKNDGHAGVDAMGLLELAFGTQLLSRGIGCGEVSLADAADFSCASYARCRGSFAAHEQSVGEEKEKLIHRGVGPCDAVMGLGAGGPWEVTADVRYRAVILVAMRSYSAFDTTWRFTNSMESL